jgi:hypothetical protein
MARMQDASLLRLQQRRGSGLYFGVGKLCRLGGGKGLAVLGAGDRYDEMLYARDGV